VDAKMENRNHTLSSRAAALRALAESQTNTQCGFDPRVFYTEVD